jgi:hypothetical protein
MTASGQTPGDGGLRVAADRLRSVGLRAAAAALGKWQRRWLCVKCGCATFEMRKGTDPPICIARQTNIVEPYLSALPPPLYSSMSPGTEHVFIGDAASPKNIKGRSKSIRIIFIFVDTKTKPTNLTYIHQFLMNLFEPNFFLCFL